MNLATPTLKKLKLLAICGSIVPLLLVSCGQNIDPVPTISALPTSSPHTLVPSTPTQVSDVDDNTPRSPEEKIVQSLLEAGGQYTSSSKSCGAILAAEPWCIVVLYAEKTSQPEWEELFPATDFYLVREVINGGELPYKRNRLIIEQAGQRYSVKSFQSLLDANNVQVSEENREIIARALILMMLSDFIDHEIRFQSWETGEWRSPIRLPFNYKMTVWTELGGFEMPWLFLFYEGDLYLAGGWIADERVGDYIEIPIDGPRPPSPENFIYRQYKH